MLLSRSKGIQLEAFGLGPLALGLERWVWRLKADIGKGAAKASIIRRKELSNDLY